jgi:radical SAM superfamily enzyme YgiQ (UPF0313 family)
MKLVLINPNFDGVVSIPSLGLGFIGTYIASRAGWDVEIIEPKLQGYSRDDVLRKASDASVVGLVCYTESRFQCFDFVRRLKRMNPSVKVIVGGPHVNTLDSQIMRHYAEVDAVVRMESEESVLDIINGKPLSAIPGITWRNQQNVTVRNPDRPLRSEINTFTYDYSLVFPFLNRWKDPEIPYRLQRLNAIPMIASRGCPFQCTFCAAHQQWAGTYRGLSPEELVSRIEELSRRYAIRYFRFYDALFIGNDHHILTLCDLLERSKVKISFRIDIRAGTSRQTLSRLRSVGCDVVGMGIESGSDRILARVNKRTDRKKIKETVAVCRELGYWILGFFMVSLPDETLDDIRQTLEMVNLFDGTNLQFFKLHPNTAFYEELKQKGAINDEVWFDPDYGFRTRYGHEVYYCREMFPEAALSWKEGQSLLRHAFFKFNRDNPARLIRTRGFIAGVPLVLASAAALSLSGADVRKRFFK